MLGLLLLWCACCVLRAGAYDVLLLNQKTINGDR
jgi:hypothetical protein